ncbi:replication factor C small subunit [Candidatus Woesearchaeota archaeon]|nr:replication factor C small subunit [Candidatus Woesearchaeota archaeon]
MSDSSIFIEKYRPKNFEEFVGQDIIVNRIKSFVENKNLPHLIFAGSPGVGKTTLALIIARDMFKENWRENFLELNGSDDRGINVVRETIKDFARTKPFSDVPYKIILLDESDALTREAQHALRRTMENYSNTCRFILSCNYSSKLIDPIISRCAIFRFKPLNKEDVFTILKKIAKTEGLKIEEKALELIFSASKGDVRKAENILQSSSSISKNINENLVKEIVKEVNPEDIKNILEIAISGDFIKARNKLLEFMLKEGLSGIDIIKSIQSEILNLNLEDKKKMQLIDKCGDIEFRLVEGSDEFVQLEALLSNFIEK